MRLGIEIAREVAAKKLNKQISSLTYEELKKYGPMILFNGGAYDNKLLQEALDKNIITNYPKENFYTFTKTKPIPADNLKLYIKSMKTVILT
ncbi:hypothetical protein ACJKRE_07245 [Rickettsia amblyommatis]